MDCRLYLFARRIGRPANVQMTQIPQCCPILVAHSFGKFRVIQPLIPRRLWHVLQYAQSLSNGLPALCGHLLPLRQHIIPNVILLLRSQPAPLLSSPAQFFSLGRGEIPVPIVVLENLLLVLLGQVTEFSLRLRRGVRGRRPVRIAVRMRQVIRAIRAVSLRISRTFARPSFLLRCFRRIFRLLVLRRP